MDSQSAPDALDALIPPPVLPEPATPELSHATIPNATAAAVSKVQSSRLEEAGVEMTPPPSTQIPPSSRGKTRTPTPTASHISTPPPTNELPTHSHGNRLLGGFAGSMTAAEISSASVEELRSKVPELQAALQEAKMSAAHHKLQYQMLSQESADAIERMAVEARMTQFENEIIHIAEQAKSRPGTQAQPALLQEGMIPVQKDLYHNMCREIQLLKEVNVALERECDQQQRVIQGQENEIASLGDKVTLMRERIRENREHLAKYRRGLGLQSTPRSTYSTPQRGHIVNQGQPHRFAALLQASEMASQESSQSRSKGHTRNTHSMSSLPTTPHHTNKNSQLTPHGSQTALQVPSTAPVPRTSAMRTPDLYQHHQQRFPVPVAPASEGTVSASDNDSEAETDIIDPDDDVDESHASRAASQMLRSSQEQQAKRESFQGAGMLPSSKGGQQLRQSRLFGAVRKAGVDRGGDEPPAKRARTGERAAVGLGIAGVKG